MIDIFINFSDIRNSQKLEKMNIEKNIAALADYLMKGIENDMTKSDKIIEMMIKFAATNSTDISGISLMIGKLIKPLELQLNAINHMMEEMRGIRTQKSRTRTRSNTATLGPNPEIWVERKDKKDDEMLRHVNFSSGKITEVKSDTVQIILQGKIYSMH
jgi:hypothetical protein